MTTAVPTTETRLRPRYEGANIRTWIGFKHFMYLVEEAVLDWLRTHAVGAHRLYHGHGLAVSFVDSSVQLPAALEMDDEVLARVSPAAPGLFSVVLETERAGAVVPVLRGKVTLALVREPDAPAHRPLDHPLLPSPVDALTAADGTPVDGFRWSWRARYFHCQFSDRVQHSAYVRALEEVVDRYLADRGISVGRMLAERGWIPVVSRARVRLLGTARMEEMVHTSFAVGDVLRDTLFDGRMDCWTERDGVRVPVASARILHGYAVSRGPRAGTMAELDPVVLAALTGRRS